MLVSAIHVAKRPCRHIGEVTQK